MTQEITYARFAYFDTNVFSRLAKDLSLWKPLQDFLYANDLCLAVGEGQLAELNNVDRMHESLNTLLTTLPSALIKTHQIILDEEVESYPSRRTKPLLQHPLNSLLGKTNFKDYLSSVELSEVRSEQRQSSPLWARSLIDRKDNFPPEGDSKYLPKQASLFAYILTIQELNATHRNFLLQFKDDASSLKTDIFLSSQIMAYVIFYKYYLTGLEPTKASDFGDMFHLHALPYCKLVVVERNMCGILNQIKRGSNILDGVVIKNMKFLENWQWEEEQ